MLVETPPLRVSSDPNGVYCIGCHACGRTLQLRIPPVGVGHPCVIDVDELQRELARLVARVEGLEATVAQKQRAIDAQDFALRGADGQLDSL